MLLFASLLNLQFLKRNANNADFGGLVQFRVHSRQAFLQDVDPTVSYILMAC